MKKTTFFALMVAFSLLSCSKPTVECDGSSPTYVTQVKAIFDANCASCHGTGSNKGDFSTYQKPKDVVNNGKFEEEVLVRQSMPRGSKLASSQLNTLKCWLDNGAPEN
jgi:mono/diheme cytochrome c family protein